MAVERVFLSHEQHVNYVKSRNYVTRHGELFEASLIIKTSFGNKSCEQFYENLAGSEKLLKKVDNSSKCTIESMQVEKMPRVQRFLNNFHIFLLFVYIYTYLS